MPQPVAGGQSGQRRLQRGARGAATSSGASGSAPAANCPGVARLQGLVRQRLEASRRTFGIHESLRKHRAQPRGEAAAAVEIAEEGLPDTAADVESVELRVQGVGQLARRAGGVDGVASAVQHRTILEHEVIPRASRTGGACRRDRQILEVQRRSDIDRRSAGDGARSANARETLVSSAAWNWSRVRSHVAAPLDRRGGSTRAPLIGGGLTRVPLPANHDLEAHVESTEVVLVVDVRQTTGETVGHHRVLHFDGGRDPSAPAELRAGDEVVARELLVHLLERILEL